MYEDDGDVYRVPRPVSRRFDKHHPNSRKVLFREESRRVYCDVTITAEEKAAMELSMKRHRFVLQPTIDKRVYVVVTKQKDYSSRNYGAESITDFPTETSSSIASSTTTIRSRRGKEMLEEAMKKARNTKTPSQQGELALAHKLGIKVMSLSEFRKRLSVLSANKVKSKAITNLQDSISSSSSSHSQPRTRPPSNMFTTFNTFSVSGGGAGSSYISNGVGSVSGSSIRAKKVPSYFQSLRGEFVKIEDMSGMHRPMIKELPKGGQIIPDFNINSMPGRCPFLPLKLPTAQQPAVPKKDRRHKVRRDLRGHCGNCNMPFKNGLDDHCKSEAHQRFARNVSHFANIDQLTLSHGLSLEDFLVSITIPERPKKILARKQPKSLQTKSQAMKSASWKPSVRKRSHRLTTPPTTSFDPYTFVGSSPHRR